RAGDADDLPVLVGRTSDDRVDAIGDQVGVAPVKLTTGALRRDDDADEGSFEQPGHETVDPGLVFTVLDLGREADAAQMIGDGPLSSGERVRLGVDRAG